MDSRSRHSRALTRTRARLMTDAPAFSNLSARLSGWPGLSIGEIDDTRSSE
jgi:hypothetical protein